MFSRKLLRILLMDQRLHRKVKKQGKTGLKTELFLGKSFAIVIMEKKV